MSEQRRQFFRVQDEGIIEIEQIDHEDLVQVKKNILEQNFDQNDIFKRFFKYESDLQSILFNNKTLSTDWLNIVDLLNVKINQLGKLLAINHDTIFNRPTQEINLSANGIGIDFPHALPDDSLVKVELVLFPQYTFLTLLARVVYCDKKDKITSDHAVGYPYTIGLQIEVIRPQDTDRLIQHIMKKEAEWLKYRREQALNQINPPLNK